MKTKSERAEAKRQRQEQADRIKAAQEAARKIVAGGKCPTCGGGLRRNTSMAGWWQCEQLGAEAFRKDPTKPPCNWQAFTE